MNRSRKIVLFFLLGLSLVPLVATLLGKDIRAGLRDENRTLAQWPKWSWSAALDATYFDKVSTCFSDHFGMRSLLIAETQRLDWTLFRRGRDDLVYADDGYVDYKFIVKDYTQAVMETLDPRAAVDSITELDRRLRERGIHFTLVHFPNKELLFGEKVPSYWRAERDTKKIVYYEISEALQKRGVDVIILEPTLRELSQRMEVFPKAEENHISPLAFFEVMGRLLRHGNELFDVNAEVPSDFPKARFEQPSDFGGYHGSFAVNSAYAFLPPWTNIHDNVWEYSNGSGPLPATYVLTDSFLQRMSFEFGQVFLPRFSRLSLHYHGPDWQSIEPEVRWLIVGTSDQNYAQTCKQIWQLVEQAKEQAKNPH